MIRLLTLGRLTVVPPSGHPEGGPRPRRLALLAILAAAGPHGASRDRVIAILWPEGDEERGRHALSQTLYSLRRDLGRDVVLAGADLRLDPSEIRSDLDDLREAIAGKQWDRVLELYQAPFAHGFHLSDAQGFDEWADEERRRIEVDALGAIESAAVQAQASGNLVFARRCWSRLTLADPLSGRYAAGLIATMASQGDNVSALAHARSHADLVRRELEVEPDPAVRDLVARLRTPETGPASPNPRLPPPGEQPATSSSQAQPRDQASLAEPRAGAGGRRRYQVAAVTVVALALAGAGLWQLAGSGGSSARPVLAVGTLKDLATPGTVQASGVLGDMLSTSLARLSDVEVVASSRILQLLPSEPDPSGRHRVAAARQAGAREILEGEITRAGIGLRLDLRRVDLGTGRVRRGYVVTAPDRFALVDSATAAVGRDLAVTAPSSSVAEVTTRSPIAYRMYEEGLRAYYALDATAALRFFRSALEEDSTFALAAYYAWRLTENDSLGLKALRLTNRAPDRERLLMRVQISGNDPGARAAVDSLMLRFPSDPEALVWSARVLAQTPAPVSRLVALVDHAIAVDSSAAPSPHRDLRLAEAMSALWEIYSVHDSTAACRRTLNRWIALQPKHPIAWQHLGELEEVVGNTELADRMYARHNALAENPWDPIVDAVWRGVNRGEPALIVDACRPAPAHENQARRGVRRWYCAIGLRHLGRRRSALAILRPDWAGAGALPRDRINEAVLDFDMGRPRLAARTFHEYSRNLPPTVWPALKARHAAWFLTLSATAHVAAGDTLAARGLLSTIQSAGAGSLYGRDPRLHHFVSGLLLATQNRHAEALDAYRQAVHSWRLGFTRVNLEYARSAVALGRPQDAIYPLQAALRGGMEGPQLYITRTELHEALAQAFDRAGLADSAATHYRYVARMWAEADAPLRPRHDQAVAWLARRGTGR